MIRTSRALLFGGIFALVLSIATFFGGWMTAVALGKTPVDTFFTGLLNLGDQAGAPRSARAEFKVFWEVWNIVESEFYTETPLDKQKMVYGAISGMMATLGDKYTLFQEPTIAEQTRESMSGKFEGIGAYLQVINGEASIVRPIRNSPAAKAGLLSNDVIVKIDGVEVSTLIADQPDDQAVQTITGKIRGNKGEPVTLTLRRPPATETFDLTIVRDEVPVETVYGEMLDNGVAYIQISEFKATTTDNLDLVLAELLAQKPTSIVLDLRDNPGGLLRISQEVLGRFYEGTALYEREQGDIEKELKTIAPDDASLKVYDLPMVVLVNGNSASASEIVAGALRDMRPNTTLLGEKTFGKGSVQNVHQLSDGSSARVTIARWLTPNRSVINAIGITPQYQVAFSNTAEFAVTCVAGARPPEGQTECSDSQLSWGLRFLLQGETPPPAPASGVVQMPISSMVYWQRS